MTGAADLPERRAGAVPRGIAHATAVFAARARNAELWDTQGRRYVDFAAGIAVLNTGHGHPRVVEAVRAQLDAFTHAAFQVTPYEVYVALAERLNALAPFRGAAKTALFTTGAEAVENAVKIARVATGRPAIIAFSGGFHGRTHLGMALTGKVSPYKRGMSGLPGDIHHLPFPQPGVPMEETLRALALLQQAVVPADRIAAILIEPVQGEGGFHPAPAALLLELRRMCDAHGILLIADEVQSGFARTGRMFAIEHAGVEPDLVAIAKSLAGGLPLSGVIGRASLMDLPEPGALGGTYAGNPLACAAALAVLDVIETEGLCARAERLGARLRGAVEAIARRNDRRPIAHLRGLGAMVGFDIVTPGAEPQPDAAATREVVARAVEAGLLLLSCGAQGNTIRLLPPLTIADAELEVGLARLDEALRP